KEMRGGGITYTREGPVELWDTTTGRLVARLDAPPLRDHEFRFLSERWVITSEGHTTLGFSAADGRLLARPTHLPREQAAKWWSGVVVSPPGRSIVTIPGKRGAGVVIREWDVETWQVRSSTTGTGDAYHDVRYLMDDTSGGGAVVALGGGDDHRWTVYRTGR